MEWNDLKTNPPTGNEYAVILFPCRSDCGILYTASNPHYAIKNGVASGYTHWSEIQLAPNHDKMVEWQNNLTNEEIENSLLNIRDNFLSLETHDVVVDNNHYADLKEPHPHSTKEFTANIAETWRLNDERNRHIDTKQKHLEDLDCIAEIEAGCYKE